MRVLDAVFIRSDDGRLFTYEDYWSFRAASPMRWRHSRESWGPGCGSGCQERGSAGNLLACARLGAIFLPLNSAYTTTEVDYFVKDAEPSLLICEPAKFEALSKISSAVLTLDDRGGGSLVEVLQSQPDAFADAKNGWDDAIALLYTSGTTGKSKGALLTHGNLASNALTLVGAWGFGPLDVLIHALPIYHTHGLFTATNTVLLSGGSLLFRRKFEVDDVIALFPQATSLMGVPTFYTRLLSHEGLTRESVKHMRLFISGSAPLLAETHRAFEEKTGHAILERFGMTETNMNTSNPYRGERRAGTVGLPLPGIEVRVSDPATGTSFPPGNIGMIEVRGPNVFKGYWRNPEKTALEFRPDGFFITGDLGSFDGQGYLTISGRGKDLVITGFNVPEGN
jgi:malonyl-CoA/methylmalonyl-CoA synthetase